jgi:NAD(P)-dependent dehydrogenase (short-subunit alcohol dehydrogenase family)
MTQTGKQSPKVDTTLSGKVALVTGGSRGVGAVTARMLAERGADVVITYRDKERRAQQVIEQVEAAGSEGLAVRSDMTDEASVVAMFAQIRERFGRLDVVVLNASGGLEKDAPSDYAMRLNRDAQVSLVESALPLMTEGGRIIFVTSHLAHFHGQKPVMPEYEVVASSKKAGEDALRGRIPHLAKSGVSLVVVSGDLIDGTITPKLLNRMRPGVIDERRQEAGWLPTTEDFARAIANVAGSDQEAGTTTYVGSTEWAS